MGTGRAGMGGRRMEDPWVRVAPGAQTFPGSHPLTSAGVRAENPCIKQGLVLYDRGFALSLTHSIL